MGQDFPCNRVDGRRIVALETNCCFGDELLLPLSIAALLAGLLSEFIFICGPDGNRRQTDNVTTGSCCGPIQLGRQGPAQSHRRDDMFDMFKL